MSRQSLSNVQMHNKNDLLGVIPSLCQHTISYHRWRLNIFNDSWIPNDAIFQMNVKSHNSNLVPRSQVMLRTGDGQTDWVFAYCNVSICSSEERVDQISKALNILVPQSSDPYSWSWDMEQEWKMQVAKTSHLHPDTDEISRRMAGQSRFVSAEGTL